jgi:hypothetical protein
VTVLDAQLGNQMFQYAAGRALASARSVELILYAPNGIKDLLTPNFSVKARRWEESDRKDHAQLSVFLEHGFASRVRKRIERNRSIDRRRWYENDWFRQAPSA